MQYQSVESCQSLTFSFKCALIEKKVYHLPNQKKSFPIKKGEKRATYRITENLTLQKNKHTPKI